MKYRGRQTHDINNIGHQTRVKLRLKNGYGIKQGELKQVRSNQTQTGTNELMMTERGQEGPYMGTRGRETQDMGIHV